MEHFPFDGFPKHIDTIRMHGCRRFLESGTAIESRRGSPSAKGMSGGRAREG